MLYKPQMGLITGGGFRNHPRYRDCVGHWLLSEGAGLNAYDISGYGNTGTLTNGPTWSNGLYGPALSFDGTDDEVNAGNASILQILSSLSVSAWVYATAFPNGDDNNFFTKSQDINRAIKFSATVDNTVQQIYFSVSNDGTTTIRRYTATTITANVWYHVVGVYDATALTLDIYLNGQLDNGTLVGTVPASVFNSVEPIRLGTLGSRPDRSWQGLLDDVRLYNRPLFGDEVWSLYESPFLEFAQFQPPRALVTVAAGTVVPPLPSIVQNAVARAANW